jgi:hypothetical protein
VPEGEQHEVADLSLQQARKFLKKLRDLPFVTLVFEGDHCHIYARGLNGEQLRIIEQLVHEIEGA